jgi:mannose-6-phosphate isomerase-like protein (cupin superfamily)
LTGRAEADPLSGRVARFTELEPSDALFIDTVLPGYARTIWSIIGANVGEDRAVQPAIPADGFHLAVIEAAPGNGSALHTHTTVEVFMALSGRWSVIYGDTGEHEAELAQWDVCSVPARVWRGFRNVGDSSAHLLAIVGGTDAGRLTWAPEILEAARERGAMLDDEGFKAPPTGRAA